MGGSLLIIQADKVVVLKEQESEIDLVENGFIKFEELNDLEFDRDTVRNIRVKAALILDLIKSSDQVIRTSDPPRTKHEINGAYKIATRRGTRLNEVELFNLYFKFRSHLRGDGIALMYRTKDNKERIILLPDDTKRRIKIERRLFLDTARDLVFSGKMNPDAQSDLIENLKLLNIHERCAQTLQHEYGHILHWREFDSLGIHTDLEVYDWFVDSGYLDIIDMRVPNFADKPVQEKILILKESLVEDYRISLNLSENNGMFILPNKFCHFGDFQIPDLLKEGVRVMKEMLNSQIKTPVKRPRSSSELDSLSVIREISREGFRTGWVAGKKSTNETSIARDREALRVIGEVAATTEYV